MKRRYLHAPRRLRVEKLEARQCLTASVGWDGPGRGAAQLTYYVEEVPATVGLTQAEVETAIGTALAAWSDAADITFTETTRAGQLDSLDFSFRTLDGAGGTLARAYFPDDINPARLAGDVQFDLSDRWEIGNARGSAAFDLLYVAVHEIGHALGLPHQNAPGSVLRDAVSPQQAFQRLAPADVDAMLTLYAPTKELAPAPTSAPPPSPVPATPAITPNPTMAPRSVPSPAATPPVNVPDRTAGRPSRVELPGAFRGIDRMVLQLNLVDRTFILLRDEVTLLSGRLGGTKGGLLPGVVRR